MLSNGTCNKHAEPRVQYSKPHGGTGAGARSEPPSPATAPAAPTAAGAGAEAEGVCEVANDSDSIKGAATVKSAQAQTWLVLGWITVTGSGGGGV